MNYQLSMRIEIRQIGEHGEYMGSAGNLNVSEDIQFQAGSFLEIARILGEFHEMSQKIKEASQ